MKTRSKLILAGLAMTFLAFAGWQINKLQNNVSRANDSAERVVDVIERAEDATGEAIGDVLENVDAQELGEGLTEGAKELGRDLKQAWKRKLDEKKD